MKMETGATPVLRRRLRFRRGSTFCMDTTEMRPQLLRCIPKLSVTSGDAGSGDPAYSNEAAR